MLQSAMIQTAAMMEADAAWTATKQQAHALPIAERVDMLIKGMHHRTEAYISEFKRITEESGS